MFENLTHEEEMHEVFIMATTPPNRRNLGRGGLNKLPEKGYVKRIEIAIDWRGSLGWQFKDTAIADPSKQWVDYPFIGVEFTVINYQIREKKIDEAKQLAADKEIVELEEEIEALTNNPTLREKKEEKLEILLQSLESSGTYVYLMAVDRQNQYSIRMHPDNLFAISLFNQLRIIVTEDLGKEDRDNHRLYHAIKIGIEKRPSKRASDRTVAFATVWTFGDKPVWVGDDEQMSKASWRPIWKDVITSVGEYIRELHNQPDLDKNNYAIAGRQVSLPPAKAETGDQAFLQKIKEAANEAYNNKDMARLEKSLERVTYEQKTIQKLGSLAPEAKKYVEEAINILAEDLAKSERESSPVINVNSEPVF